MSQRSETIAFNVGIAGLASDLRVQLLNADGSANGSPLSGLIGLASDGSYGMQVTLPANFIGFARLENATTGEQYAVVAVGRADVDGLTWWEMLAVVLAAVAGKTSGFQGIAAASGAMFFGPDGSSVRITADTDTKGNRTVITLSPPS